MQPDRATQLASRTFIPGCPTAKRLAAGPLLGSPISVLRRSLDADTRDALDSVAADRLPSFRFTAAAADLRSALRRHFDETSFGPPSLASWLFDDVLFLAHFYLYLTPASSLTIRLEAISTNACTRFHADNVRLRLVTTYRGPGTQFLGPRALALQLEGKPLTPGAIRTVDAGAILLMRGSKGATADCPALLHRSPPIEGAGITRLFLAIDDADDVVS